MRCESPTSSDAGLIDSGLDSERLVLCEPMTPVIGSREKKLLSVCASGFFEFEKPCEFSESPGAVCCSSSAAPHRDERADVVKDTGATDGAKPKHCRTDWAKEFCEERSPFGRIVNKCRESRPT